MGDMSMPEPQTFGVPPQITGGSRAAPIPPSHARGSSEEMQNQFDKLVVRERATFRWFHPLPLFRLYLVTKNLRRHDIEVVFRLNSLSSFTLGVCQLVCIGITIALPRKTPDLIICINVVSQVVNWLITILYFATNIAEDMKETIIVKAVASHLRARQQRTLMLFFQAIRPIGHMDEEQDDVRKIKVSLIAEIEYLCRPGVHLNGFTVAELLELRKKLYKRQVHNMHRMS